MNRLPGVVALLGLALAAGAVVALTVTSARWVLLLSAAGTWLVLAYLAWTARGILREVRTLRAGVAVGRDRTESLVRSRAADQQALLEEARAEVRALAARVDEAAATLAAGQSGLGDEVRAAAGELRSGVAELSTDVAAIAGSPVLAESPALAAWRWLSGRRREGVCCLMVGPDDAAAVLALADGTAGRPGAAVEAWDPAAGAPAGAPATPAHAVGAVLVDLDRAAGTGGRALATFLRWLRPEVPVAGFTRVPALLPLRAARLGELADGVLLPVPVSAHGVRFVRHSDVPRSGDHDHPTTAGGPRAA
ncbi:hypothetical protein E7744_09390 [Citricoccus sp. SGAir0253]|uniref:hypothetical protein n=1 Tax=Citricoccus sp. SGAir0253 TaxID=2567881 RepID=UPI0010CD268B|nr:hypothetical protein [Citricoccus sp. SGAir0253]QCU78354.1 hypothetical protein E7744_09390 [Citricoccus sp. SGAir0253]